jgi:hypothetical protein
MNRLTRAYLTTAAIALVASGSAVAGDSSSHQKLTQTASISTSAPTSATSENIDVTALMSTPVAVRGSFAANQGQYIILDRPSGSLAARVDTPSGSLLFPLGAIQNKLSKGDLLTVYGTLRRGSDGAAMVEADAVYDQNLQHLFLTERGEERSSEWGNRATETVLRYRPVM